MRRPIESLQTAAGLVDQMHESYKTTTLLVDVYRRGRNVLFASAVGVAVLGGVAEAEDMIPETIIPELTASALAIGGLHARKEMHSYLDQAEMMQESAVDLCSSVQLVAPEWTSESQRIVNLR